MRIAIVKTSSLGDIIQCMPVLGYLQKKFPHAKIDWVVEESLVSVVKSHPFVHQAIAIPFRSLKKRSISFRKVASFFRSLQTLRSQSYDLLFDLQGNCKSGFLTWICKAEKKIGFDLKSVREWPNVLCTKTRFFISKKDNMRLQYLGLLRKYFGDTSAIEIERSYFLLASHELSKINAVLQKKPARAEQIAMICPGSKWINKQLSLSTWIDFLQKIEEKSSICFLFVWGSLEEKQFCMEISKQLKDCIIAEKMEIPSWQYLMNEMDFVIAVDSSALHLCGTTKTPSFSIFGPTSAEVFKPLGSHHFALQGPCPYGRTFLKQCPKLRTCPTGACIRELTGATLYSAFNFWRSK